MIFSILEGVYSDYLSATGKDGFADGSVGLHFLLRLRQHLPSVAITRALVEADASSKSAAAGDRATNRPKNVNQCTLTPLTASRLAVRGEVAGGCE